MITRFLTRLVGMLIFTPVFVIVALITVVYPNMKTNWFTAIGDYGMDLYIKGSDR